MKSAKTTKDFNEAIKSLRIGYREYMEDIGGESGSEAEIAYEMAKMTVDENPWISDYMKKQGIRDVLGRLADEAVS